VLGEKTQTTRRFAGGKKRLPYGIIERALRRDVTSRNRPSITLFAKQRKVPPGQRHAGFKKDLRIEKPSF